MLSTAPNITDVLPEFLDFIGDSIVIRHNVNFDINFIYDTCIEILHKPFKNNFIDTMRLSRRLFQQFQKTNPDKIKYYFDLILPLYTKNIVLSPRLWEKWDEEKQMILLFLPTEKESNL